LIFTTRSQRPQSGVTATKETEILEQEASLVDRFDKPRALIAVYLNGRTNNRTSKPCRVAEIWMHLVRLTNHSC
jgi:hypothetical protein